MERNILQIVFNKSKYVKKILEKHYKKFILLVAEIEQKKIKILLLDVVYYLKVMDV
ncbi:MAG: hypothetical protein ACE5SW_01520 [Nitrososphaeraceae archaeon]